MWGAAQRLLSASKGGTRPCTIIHLGDHDPSGIDMTRDIRERMAMFGSSGCELTVRRIALNMDQIDLYSPPPNPTKLTDTRAEKYMAEFGETSWELDALEPSKLDALVDETIVKYIDAKLMKKAKKRQAEEKDELADAEDFVRNRHTWAKINAPDNAAFYEGAGI
jgi:hypothetical protein